jgi:hypothetical protein
MSALFFLNDRYRANYPAARGHTKRRIDLGVTESEMYRNLADRVAPATMRSMSAVFDRFLVEVPPTLAKRTQADYQGYIEHLGPAFGSAAPNEITAPDIFEFRAALARSRGTSRSIGMSPVSRRCFAKRLAGARR